MADETTKAVQNQFIKWGFLAIVGLIGAGLVSLANRDVYSKEQVDEKLHHVQEVQRMQNNHTNEQLQLIRDDVHEIKDLIRSQDGE